jgi:DNA-binding response OmpR family regulator
MPDTESLNGCTVLVVEDRYMIASDIAEEVAGLGAEVLGPAPNLAAAGELIRLRRPDIALLDVNLDGEMVYPLAEDLAGRGVRIAFLTGYEAEVVDEAWRERPRLMKPVDTKMLREMLREMLRSEPCSQQM